MLNHFLPFDDNANKGLSILCFVGILWLTEAIHITTTAILIPLIAIIVGIPNMDTKTALAGFSDPIIYIFLGGFALAAALNVQKLDKKIALWIMSLSKGYLSRATLIFFVATALLSMWISNTVTAAMMIPLSLSLISQLDLNKDRPTIIFILLGIAYSSSIGGIGLLIGSPPNGIIAKHLGMDFSTWLAYALPLSLIMFPALLFCMYLVLHPNLKRKIVIEQEIIPWTPARITTICLFILTAICWVFGKPLSEIFGFASPDTVIALIAAVLVVTLGLASWRQVSERTEWGVLLLIGGGIILSNIMKNSGASLVLGQFIADHLSQMPVFVIVLIVATFMIFLTEFTSNTASTALMVPVFASVGTQLGLPDPLLVMVVGVGASYAFMLPVAVPPNGMVFATGHIKQSEMVKIGFILNWISILLVSVWAYLCFS